MKKWMTTLLLLGLCFALAACGMRSVDEGQNADPRITTAAATEPPVGQVRILNTDPQLQTVWETLAAEYSELTGADVQVLSEEDDAAPTLLQVADESQLPESCVDLSETAAYAQLASWNLALQDEEGRVCAIASEIEVFGLVYNSTLLAKTSHTRADIQSFQNLTDVVYAITDRKQQLGFSAFVRALPDERLALQLSSVIKDARSLIDLIVNNATCDPLTLSESTQPDALQDFLDGKAVFFLAGSSEHETLAAIGTENMGVLPVYMGMENEENQSLCVAARGYWCIDKNASELDVQATVDFLNFLVQPGADGTVPVDDLGRMAPYRRAAYVSNILESSFRSDIAAGKEPVVCQPAERIPDGMKDALAAYMADPSDQNWEAIVTLMG